MAHRLRHGRLLGQRHVGVRGDDLRNLADRQGHGAVIVAGAQVGDHGAADIAQFAVGQNAFQAVAHVDAALMVAYRQQDKHAFICALAADLPLVFKLIGVIGRVIPIQRLHSHDCDLRFGLGVVKLAAHLVDLRNRLRREHVGNVAYIVRGGGQVCDPLGHQRGGETNREDRQEQPENVRRCAAKAFHRSPLYAAEHEKVPRRRNCAPSIVRPLHDGWESTNLIAAQATSAPPQVVGRRTKLEKK